MGMRPSTIDKSSMEGIGVEAPGGEVFEGEEDMVPPTKPMAPTKTVVI